MLIIQNSNRPARIRNAIVDLIAENTISLQVASAYVTRSGSNYLLNALENAVGVVAFAEMPKTIIAAFDYGITEPLALRNWLTLENAVIMVSGAQRLEEENSLVPVKAYHPKMYIFGKDDQTSDLLVGSANLTGRGFSVNTEAAWVQQNVPTEQIDAAFEMAQYKVLALSDQMLDRYTILRQAQPPPPAIQIEADPVAPPPPIQVGLPLFRDSIRPDGNINPDAYQAMWVQGEGLQGGSRNQLELPRGGHRFFGFKFQQYDYPHNLTIGLPVLRSGSQIWDDRPLTWHGNNQMERLNLPTAAQGGFDYANSGVMFRRLQDGSFELIVAPWESDLARAWRQASYQSENLFRLGVRAGRLVGLI